MDLPAPAPADRSLGLAATAASSLPSSSKRRRITPALPDCCRTCRLRKVKCSGNPGTGPCTICSRLELSCNFSSADDHDDNAVSRTTPSHSHTEAGTLRKRAQRACSQCHAHKTKCSGDLPRCKRCETANLTCEYTPAKRRFANVRFQASPSCLDSRSSASGSAANRSDGIASPSPSSSSSGPASFALVTDASNFNAEDMLARRDLILRHMDAYMDHMYWLPSQGFIHPENTYREIQQGTLDPAQAAVICAVASFFVNPGDTGREFGLKCSNYVELYLFQNIYKFSDDLLVLFALNITFNLIHGSFAKVWQCFGIASRLMLGLQINWDVLPRDRSFIQQESLRRIAWQLFHMDRMLAGGYEEYISCRAENMKIPLPCNEAAFRENRPIVAERLYDKPGKPPSTINLHAFQIRLIDLRHRIQVTTKRLCSASSAHLPHLDASKVMADINGLQNELTRFHASLPADVLLSDQSISRYMASPERPGYVFLHTHLAVSHIDLYRFSLPGQREKVPVEILRKLPREFLARSQKQAVAHAMCLGRFCDAIQNEVDQMGNTGKIELAGDYSTFQMSTHCVRVLLVALQHHLYRDLTEETTAPLWRSVQVDEAHIRFLINSVQRITEPWCRILKIAQQAYDHNRTLVEEFDKTHRISDQQPAGRFPRQRAAGDSRLPGPDSLLENIAAGTSGDYKTPLSADGSVSDRWLRSSHSQPGNGLSYQGSHFGGFTVEPGTPGVPLLLAQARTASMDPSELPAVYDADNAMMAMTDLDGTLADGSALLPPSSVPMLQMAGGLDTALYQPPQSSQPSSSFMMTHQGVFMDGYEGQYTSAGGQAPDGAAYGQQPGYG